MAKEKTLYFCTNCGNEFPKWQGKCPACGQWNTIVEADRKISGTASKRIMQKSACKPLAELDMGDEIRFDTGIGELNRVLGGGAVRGSLILISGEPGIGKSTLLLQICQSLCRNGRVLYMSGEESGRQLKIRADRLGVSSDNLFVLSENDLNVALDYAAELKPSVLIVDSIQTVISDDNTAIGSVSQVKACTFQLMQYAKSESVTVFVVGHVNKDGAIAGPKVLEHMVDCVLYFEGDRHTTYRILRAAKNRFGSTNEIGVFDMKECGLSEVDSPSKMLLAGRPESSPGTCIACVMEGTRPVLAEIQALLVNTSFNVPRRTTNGFDYSRAMMLLAVAEKRGGIHSGNCDAYINVVGGLTIDEPAADLPMVLAVFSSAANKPLGDDIVAIGEVGLTGELRSVSMIEQRIKESARLGFKRCIIPAQGTDGITAPDGLKLIRVRDIIGAINSL